MIVPPSGSGHPLQRIEIDGRTLSKATRARNKLFLRFPRALPAIVGDRDLWYRTVATRLEILKSIINHDAGLPSLEHLLDRSSLTRRDRGKLVRLSQESRDLEAPLCQLAWIHLEEKAFRKVAHFLLANETKLQRVASLLKEPNRSRLVVILGDLASSGRAETAQTILDTLNHPATFMKPLSERLPPPGNPTHEAICRKADWRPLRRRSKLQWPEPSDEPIGSSLVGFICDLSKLDEDRWNHAVAWLEVLLPCELLDRWETYWSEIHALRRKADALYAMPTAGEARMKDRDRMARAFRRLETEGVPQRYPDVLILQSILRETERDRSDRRWQLKAVNTLRELPESTESLALRLNVFLLWDKLAKNFGWRPLKNLIILTQKFLEDRKTVALRSRVWRRELPRHLNYDNLEYRFLKGELGRARETDIFDLYRCWCDLELDNNEDLGYMPFLDFGAALLAATGNGKRSGKILCELFSRGLLKLAYELSTPQQKAVLLLSSGDTELIAQLLPRIGDVDLIESIVAGMRSLSQTDQVRQLLTDLILSREGVTALRLIETYNLMVVLAARDASVIRRATPRKLRRPPTDAVNWLRRYPTRLHPVLKELARDEEDAEEIVHHRNPRPLAKAPPATPRGVESPIDQTRTALL
jgi:hypothetical protein